MIGGAGGIVPVCNQAIGALETGANIQHDEGPSALRHVPSWLIALITTVMAGLIVAYLAFRFGWVGK